MAQGPTEHVGVPDYDAGKGAGRGGLTMLQDIAFDMAERDLPQLIKAMGKPVYAREKIRIEPIDQAALAAADAWKQPERRDYVDALNWSEIWDNYADQENRFGLAIWVDQPVGKPVLAGMAAGSIYDDREPGRLDIDYIESPKKDQNPIPGAARFIAVSAALATARGGNLPELRFVDTNPGSEALFKAIGHDLT
ncbi:MAG: hypothetical protein AAF556_09970, partial [Pseudomonadota bacterium]